jgi:hypothetical protein
VSALAYLASRQSSAVEAAQEFQVPSMVRSLQHARNMGTYAARSSSSLSGQKAFSFGGFPAPPSFLCERASSLSHRSRHEGPA